MLTLDELEPEDPDVVAGGGTTAFDCPVVVGCILDVFNLAPADHAVPVKVYWRLANGVLLPSEKLLTVKVMLAAEGETCPVIVT